MKLLIVEDDPSLREILAELVQAEISDAEILEADNLDDAVKTICSPEPRVPNPESRVPNPESRAPSPEPQAAVAAILTDGTFPTWPQKVLPTSKIGRASCRERVFE